MRAETYTLKNVVGVNRSRDVEVGSQTRVRPVRRHNPLPCRRRHERGRQVRVEEQIERDPVVNQPAPLLRHRPHEQRHLRDLPALPRLHGQRRQRDVVALGAGQDARRALCVDEGLRGYAPHALQHVRRVGAADRRGDARPHRPVGGVAGGGEAEGTLAAEHDGPAEGDRGCVVFAVGAEEVVDGGGAGGVAPDRDF